MSYIFIQGQEQFKPITGFPEYEIGDHGNVRSLKNGKVKVLKAVDNNRGYLKVVLCNGSIRKDQYVHRLVAQHFIPNPESKPEVNHLNGKTDNRVCSLEFVTREENIQHAYDNGLYEKQRESVRKTVRELNKNKAGENHHNCKITDEDVNGIRIKYATGNYTQKVLSDEYGVSRAQISNIINFKKRSRPTPQNVQ